MYILNQATIYISNAKYCLVSSIWASQIILIVCFKQITYFKLPAVPSYQHCQANFAACYERRKKNNNN